MTTTTTMIDADTSSIVIGSGDDRVSINLKAGKTTELKGSLLSSILIEMDGLEIEIRRTNKTISARSKSVNHRAEYREKKLPKEEKSKTSQSHWDYSDLCGPNMWSQMYPQLQSKKFQSPIRIYTNLSEYEPVLARHPFIFQSDDNCCETLENTGHSFQVSGKGTSYITGGPALDEYQFLQFHMHWGANDNEGSEHVIDGIRLSAELHIVTWNTSQYKTPQEAVASEKFGGLMVFGILIKIGSTDNPDIAKLLDLFPKITHKGDKITLDSSIVSLKSLLPENMENYYTYDGSLTTPMCNESVRWVVFRERMSLSQRQLNQLRQLKHTCKSDKCTNGHMTKNFRPLMPLNGRIIYRSFDLIEAIENALSQCTYQ